MSHTREQDIVLQNFWKHTSLHRYTKPYYQYISIINKIKYSGYVNNTINKSIATIGINDFCIMNKKIFLDYVIKKLEKYSLVLPEDIHLPLHLTSFIASNNEWVANFFQKYKESNTNNLQLFLEKNNLLKSNRILFTNEWCSYSRDSIVTNLINLDISTISHIFQKNNNNLEIV